VNVRPVLGDWEVPRVDRIEADERRRLVELPVPGRVGSLYQDLSSAPTRIAIRGSIFGDEDRGEFLEELRGKFQAGEPVTFVADIVTATQVQYVVIETLEFVESGARPDELTYFIVLRESPPPPPPPDPLGGLDAGLLDDVGGFLDTITGALDVIDGLGSVPDLADPTPPLTSAVSGVTDAISTLEGALGPLVELLGSDE
jgi:hypothetical protein